MTSPRTTTSTRRAWTPAHTSSAHQSTATGNWPAPRVLTRGISSSRARAPCAPDERGDQAPNTSRTVHTWRLYAGGLNRRRQNPGWNQLGGVGGKHGMMGARHSTMAAAEQGGKALAWSAEVTWSDDTTGGGGPSPVERSTSTKEEEWCTGSLDSASETGAGGGVVLSWSWVSTWR